MKKNLFITLLALVMSFSAVCKAENAESVTEAEVKAEAAEEQLENTEEISLEKVALNIHVGEAQNLIPKNMVFGIYTKDKQFWGAERIWVTDENKDHVLEFEVPEYENGDTLYMTVFSGAEGILVDDIEYKAEELIPIIPDEDQSVFAEAKPVSGSYVKAFANEWELYFENPAKLIDGVCMIPLNEYAKALWMSDNVAVEEESGRVEIYANKHTVVFYLDGFDAYVDGELTYLNTTPVRINGEIYVPFRSLIEALGGNIKAESIDGILNVTADFTYNGLNKSEEFVKGKQSKTDYLIWVSKSDFKVTLFKRVGGIWKEVDSFPCSIGAPSTPTVTGEFDYFSKESRWSYPTYYVGPIMRFYRGYALHSTLLRYNGADADARLGKKISHGCVRMAPKDINWLVETVPLYTKVYVTD